MSGLDTYMKASSEMAAKFGFMSDEYDRLRSWWQINMDRATPEQVKMMAESIVRGSHTR